MSSRSAPLPKFQVFATTSRSMYKFRVFATESRGDVQISSICDSSISHLKDGVEKQNMFPQLIGLCKLTVSSQLARQCQNRAFQFPNPVAKTRNLYICIEESRKYLKNEQGSNKEEASHRPRRRASRCKLRPHPNPAAAARKTSRPAHAPDIENKKDPRSRSVFEMERTTGFEPATPTLARWCSTS